MLPSQEVTSLEESPFPVHGSVPTTASIAGWKILPIFWGSGGPAFDNSTSNASCPTLPTETAD